MRWIIGLLAVRCIVAIIADHGIILAGPGNRNKLLRVFASNGSTVGMNDDEAQATAGKDRPVSLSHRKIAYVHALVIGIEAVEVLHDEFAYTQQAAARARLVTKLGLNLVDPLRQIAVAAHELGYQRCHHLFMGWTKDHVASLAIPQLEQHVAKHLRTRWAPSGWWYVPEVFWLKDRHDNFLSTGTVHLLTHDLRNLVYDAGTRWQEAIDARC